MFLYIARCIACAALGLGATLAVAANSDAGSPVMTLRHEPRVILEAVAQRMGVALRADVALPAIFLESKTSVRQFQDAIAPQWRMRPRVISNAYVIARNHIYLSDDRAYYQRLKRTLDDSLAHEFVHYLQAKYFNDDLASDPSEAQAVAIQTWFREAYMRPAHENAQAQVKQNSVEPKPRGLP